ncbi:M23 family metallopeptidase [Qipengyuania nanhaisediminis]|uniref:Murein DD-endopeptidase MepM and murein hydrolase activator NlpD, contain LysM domain n=1 Tax=Qipengyuania nanhaisediminis TaxID=604088 RepID=A0A1I5KT37_9SPHN|nr:M23 family metallopeptidase [Qipengyuania nanhaisediminis]SFO87786.1 Murein DD-endopeptidase MepM and murein hydrolase activator NlpD, contain LysM domain [Qipengyuania nanhaisediminis]
MRHRVAPLLFLLTAACVAPAQGTPVTASEEVVVSEPAPAPAPTVVEEPRPEPAKPVDFTFIGELTQGGWMRGDLGPGRWTAQLGDQEIAVDDEGRFFAAFDRDSPAKIEFKATSGNLVYARETITVDPREWDIERVNVAKGTGGGGAAWWAKREPEWLAIRDARAKETGAEGWMQEFIWPVTGRISGRFGRQRIYRGEPGSYHSGIDIAPGNGAPFVAPAGGVVVLARTGFSLEGGIIILDHGAGLNSAFIHLSRLRVAEGDRVEQGQLLGNVGASGRATGPHLHWSLMWREKRLDPLLFLPPMP